MDLDQLDYRQETGLLRTENERQAGMFLHLSALFNMLVPMAGYVVPVVIWQTRKDEMPAIDAHGREAVNWFITSFIYSVVLIILAALGFVLVIFGIYPVPSFALIIISMLALFALSVVNIAYAVIAGIKAGNGEHWPYPLSIKFLK